MADVIRVVDGDRWTYVPSDGAEHSRLERFAAAKMAEVSNGSVFLKSDAGPLFWEMIEQQSPERTPIQAMSEAVGKNSISIIPDEKLTFGEKDDSIAYSKSMDISLEQRELTGPGMTIAARAIEDEEIVMTAWPKSGIFMPALARLNNRRVWLELPEPQDEGERCFVLDERCGSVMTVSFKSDGTRHILAMHPAAMDSWLCSVGSKALMGLSARFGLKTEGTDFVINDRKTGRKYRGQFIQKDGDNLEFEKMRMERLLAVKGLAAIIPTYVLKRELSK